MGVPATSLRSPFCSRAFSTPCMCFRSLMLESGSPTHRNLGLDLLRALAIVLVLTSHFGDTFASLYGGVSPHYVSISGMFGVELFFVLSGFLIGNLLLRIVRTEP